MSETTLSVSNLFPMYGVLNFDGITRKYAEGEFHVDLFTLPPALVSMLWKFVQDCGIEV
jgi:hypothetical protein